MSNKHNHWRPASTAPYDTPVTILVGRMTFEAIKRRDSSMDEDGNPCDQWEAKHEGEHPPCWSGGCCWESNENCSPSIQPSHWRYIADSDMPEESV